jgi:adenylate kinase
MRLLLIGPPGSGKGTQAHLLGKRRQLEHFSTGDLLRTAIQEGTPVGERARPFVKAGQLVPDELVNEMIAHRFEHNPPRCFVMDGYPRTLQQAQTFDQTLNSRGLGLTAVVVLVVADAEILRRLGGRRNCPKSSCKASYHIDFNPPRAPDVCDRCGTRLVLRDDDKPETVSQRLQIYHATTRDLIDYYRSRGLVHEVQGEGDIEQVHERIIHAIGEQAKEPC